VTFGIPRRSSSQANETLDVSETLEVDPDLRFGCESRKEKEKPSALYGEAGGGLLGGRL
jgi:hypothetical protein